MSRLPVCKYQSMQMGIFKDQLIGSFLQVRRPSVLSPTIGVNALLARSGGLLLRVFKYKREWSMVSHKKSRVVWDFVKVQQSHSLQAINQASMISQATKAHVLQTLSSIFS